MNINQKHDKTEKNDMHNDKKDRLRKQIRKATYRAL